MTIVEEGLMNPEANLESQMANDDDDSNDGYEDSGIEPGDSDGNDTSSPGNPEANEWVTITNHPAPTAARIRDSLRNVAYRGRNTLTLLLLGRAGMGKSSTVNSLFATAVVQAVPFHMITYQTMQPQMVRKRAEGVTLNVIDTPGLVDSDSVSETGLRRLAFLSKSTPVDVMMFVDRLDMTKPDELDLQMMAGLTRTFGADIWSRMVIGLTRADMKDPNPGQTFESIVTNRVDGLREMIRKAGGRNASVPYVLIENSDRCERNAAGEKVINREAWIPKMFETVVQVSQRYQHPYRYNPTNVNRNAELFQKFCLIPLILVFQLVVKVIVDRMIAEDGLKGDRYGPFDAHQIEYEKMRSSQKRDSSKTVRESKADPIKRSDRRRRSLEEEMDDSDEDQSDSN